MNEKDVNELSKFLSLVLRHQPEYIGIHLDEQGWTEVDTLLSKAALKGKLISPELLQHIVDTNSKKRFAFSEDGRFIRASQGHSVDVALDYAPQKPPTILFHGTSEKNISSIRQLGILKQSRHHVHLSAETGTAHKVGQRHGKPVVLAIKTDEMHRDGYSFFLSENGVWLTDHVPVMYIQFGDDSLS